MVRVGGSGSSPKTSGMGGFFDGRFFDGGWGVTFVVLFEEAICLQPAGEEEVPIRFGFVGKNEGAGASAVFDGVFGRGTEEIGHG